MKSASIKLSSYNKLYLISNLATLISSGIPILESVESLITEAKGSSKKVLEILKEDLNQGKTIAQSFARSPDAFDKVSINLIKASEESGTLETTLKDLTSSIKKDIDFSNKIKGALTYPILVIIVLLVVININLFFVIPRISKVFLRLNIDVPLPTKILIGTSNLFVNHLFMVIASLILISIFFYILFKTKRKLFIGIFSSFPLISTLITEIDITRFCRSMFLLLSSGIPITEALELTKNVVNKKKISNIIEESTMSVSSGKNLSEGFKKSHGLIPNFMVRIIEEGEKSGTLEKSMQELSEQFDERVSNRLKTLTTLLEPILLIIVGVLVGAIMLAIIAPIYNMIGKIKVR